MDQETQNKYYIIGEDTGPVTTVLGKEAIIKIAKGLMKVDVVIEKCGLCGDDSVFSKNTMDAIVEASSVHQLICRPCAVKVVNNKENLVFALIGIDDKKPLNVTNPKEMSLW